ncbi:flagellar hook-associated protein FlgK [Pseudoalteromonas byunsanensis]|uniref:Flagellar hook-associated protein 1 n=1 Tax=Pseudoalteromonas byunsanensis TaxID=327939 RepID=A0A1S1N6Y1_9GAMM|nr:flagellar hook-associated protein FlgK [Pseudoalteromonas byunsanensis]OHU95767.1 flagellar hook-associated protein FlgK [Pseudoalteromonas byunsanensis]
MSFDLMHIGTSGVRASTELLQTTSRNISNLNTKGYIRERTEHATTVGNLVGRGETVRLINDFAAKQLNRDTSNKAYYDQFVTESSRIDTLFAEESNSLSTSINNMFNSLQESMNQPSSTVSRSLFMNSAEGLVQQMHRLSNIVFDQKSVVNEQLSLYTDEANSLIEKISELNNKVSSTYTSDDRTVALSVLNERDQAIRDLSGLVDIETLDGPNGEKLIFLGSGQSLVMENGTFNAFALDGDPDPNVKDLKLDVNSGSAIALDVDLGSLKGKIGGLLAFRDEILQPAQNQLGQIGISIADAFNQQNALGMDLDGNFGGDIFDIPTVQGYAFQNNTGTGVVNATLEAGLGNSIPATDFQVTFLTATTVEIAAIDSEGNVIGTPSTANVTAGAINSGTVTSGESFGLDMTVTGAPAAGDSYVIKLNSIAAASLEMATERPEHLALASPIRTEVSANNTSTASISAGVVTDTGATSNFSSPPITLTQGQITITKTAVANQYQINDGNGTNLVTITPPGNGVLNQAGAPYASYGFDFDISGQPATGDVFTIGVNTDGFDDNRNGLALSQLKDTELVRQGVIASADNLKTFNESYASLVTEIGVIANQAKTNGAAFDALATQSETWFESISGVNLDEEAANLLRFQQSYSASAQIISAARTIFDTLLSAAR